MPNPETFPLQTQCPKCGDIEVITVNLLGYNLWKSGILIQNAMPELSTSQRERLISGWCDSCWKQLFPE
jgi:hypothetical protein